MNLAAPKEIKFKDEYPKAERPGVGDTFAFVRDLLFRPPTKKSPHDQVMADIRKQYSHRRAVERKALIQLGSIQGNLQAKRRQAERAEHGHIVTPLHQSV